MNTMATLSESPKTSSLSEQPADGTSSAGRPESLLRELADRLRESSEVPLYRQIDQQIADWIEGGQLKAGEQLPSERKLTDLLRVSRRTIRAALARLIETKYVTATHGRGNYVLDPPTRRQLRFLGLERIGAPLTTYSLYHYDLVHHAEEATNSLVHYKHAPNLEKLRETVLNPPSGYQGIMIARPSQEWVQVLLQLDQEYQGKFPLPLVITNRDLSGTSLNFVSTDHRRQAYEATTRLIRTGHRRIGFVSGSDTIDYVRIGHEGYLAALKDHDIAPDPELQKAFAIGPDERVVRDMTIFLSGKHLDGLVGGGSSFSVPIEKAIKSLAIKVPEDLSVVLLTEENVLNSLTMRWTAYLFPEEKLMNLSLIVLSELARGNSEILSQKLLPSRISTGATVRDR